MSKKKETKIISKNSGINVDKSRKDSYFDDYRGGKNDVSAFKTFFFNISIAISNFFLFISIKLSLF